MTQPMHVLVVVDDAYTLGAAALLQALGTHDPGTVVHLTTLGLSGHHLPRLQAVAEAGGLDLRVHERTAVSPPGPGPFGYDAHGHYDRLCALQDLELDRVVYLDADTLPQTSLRPLWELDLEGNLLAAARDALTPSVCGIGGVDRWWDRTDDPETPFFNAGVMVVDLVQWRRDQVAWWVMEHARTAGGRNLRALTSSLNAVAIGRWKALDPRWNWTERPRWEAAHVVHFHFPLKPWHCECDHPARGGWEAVVASTPYASLLSRSVYRAPGPLRDALWEAYRYFYGRFYREQALGIRKLVIDHYRDADLEAP